MRFSKYSYILNHPTLSNAKVLLNPMSLESIVITSPWNEYIYYGFTHFEEILDNNRPLYAELIDGKYIVEDSNDDYLDCLQFLEKKFKNSDTLRITINPTMDCNLKCWYCYESHIMGSLMDAGMVKSVIEYISNRILTNRYRTLVISFFGGEPMLGYDCVIIPILQSLFPLCEKHGVNLHCGITSNGTLLNSERALKIRNYSHNFSAQIVFDGDRNFHDKVKCFANCRGSYDIVVKNVKELLSSEVYVNVRCNYTLLNIHSFLGLIAEFADFHSNPHLYFSFHRVWQEEEEESDELHKEISLLKAQIQCEYEISSNIENFYNSGLYPCYADYRNNFVINFNGDVFKCTARSFDRENAISTISNEGILEFLDDSNEDAFVLTNYISDKCRSCKLLPICNFCVQRRKEAGNEPPCDYDVLMANIQENAQKYYEDLLRLNNLL